MFSPRIPIAIALASIAVSLGACGRSDGLPAAARITLPAAPAETPACFREPFPTIPDRDLTTSDVVRIIGRAKVLDRAKSACGERAGAWISGVRRELGRP